MAGLSLYQNLSQQQTLAPQMRKSLEILQATSLELQQLITQSLETNPALEDASESISLDEMQDHHQDHVDVLGKTDDYWRDQNIIEGKVSHWSSEDEERRQHLYNSIVAPETLQEHLNQQLHFSLVDEETRQAGVLILGNLDERGFLDMTIEELSLRFHMRLSLLKAALKLIQSFEPAGIGASSMRESLLLQLERLQLKDSIEYRIIHDHLDLLTRKHYPQIAKIIGTNIDRIIEAIEHISKLSLNPGGDFNPTSNPYILPDVIIEKNSDHQWSARLSGENLPKLKINDFYKDMMGKNGVDSKARQFLRDQIRDGKSLIRAVSLRQETILAIAHKIIEHQKDFFDKGLSFLRPLTMSEMADEIQLHATTISRAVAGKYLLCPHGLMEMRAFFASGYQTEDGGQVSNSSVRDLIQKLVHEEPSNKPLSDEALMKSLKEQGVTVARRTIAKYREQLNILPSHLRKRY